MVNNISNVNGRVIHNGLLFNGTNQFSDSGTPYTARETGGMYNSRNNGFPGGGATLIFRMTKVVVILNMEMVNMVTIKNLFLVSPSKVIIQMFSGTHLQSKPYMPFNTAIKLLIEAQGPRGFILIHILDLFVPLLI